MESKAIKLNLQMQIDQIDDMCIGKIVNNENFKGMVVSGNSKEEVINEMNISIAVKLSYDYDIELG